MKGARSFLYKVVSINSEVASMQTLSQFDTTVVNVVLFRDSLSPRPENGPGTQVGKERVLYYLQAHARNDAIFPPKLGEKPYLEKDSLFGHTLFQVLLHWIHRDNVKGNYNAKFLEAIDLAFKKCHFSFVPKAEQLQAIHAVVTGNDGFVKPPTGFGKSICYMVVPLICLRFSSIRVRC